jgi:hypothetical protein
MGGSGGAISPSSLRRVSTDLQREQQRSEDQAFGAEVSEMLNDLLAEFNDRDTKAIDGHLDDVEEAIADSIEGTVDMLFGGSVGKHTYVNGLSDVDALMLLRDESLAARTPREVLRHVGRILKAQFRGAEVTVGKLALTLKLGDGHEIQLLPAVRTRGGFRIASSDGRRWSEIKPDRFAEKLTQVNKACGGRVIPTIKLAKAINEGLPERVRLSGYHIESLAVEAFKLYRGQQTTKAMLQQFFAAAAHLVKRPIVDRTGQSVHVDDSLGAANSAARMDASRALDRTGRAMRRADVVRSVRQWKDLFESGE